MGGSNSDVVKEDFSGPLNVAGVKTTCSLHQPEGKLWLEGVGVEKLTKTQIMDAVISEKLDIGDPKGWVLAERKEGKVFFQKK